MYKVLLVDDHSIVRSGIRLLLREQYGAIQIDEAKNGSTAFSKIMDTGYNLMVMDINMPNTDTFSLLQNIRTIAPDLPIMIFTIMTEYAFAKRYLQLGVKGYISKQAEDLEILKAVHSILYGKLYVCAELLDQMAEDTHFKKELDPFGLLSNRELEIAYHLVKGKSVSHIADTLNIHTSTVGTHKARIFDKLKVDNVLVMKDLAAYYRLI
ncbi:UvrY/SirA/GacA family response regulator transcription factor [Larkinella knui]|uniref:DNA-binding response regulator n=1 Tax=Larkinella knui TaxID=2025310 RepID=A0A3P1CQV6_9BACT|nr:response regulator transcription factor [Larkinella knui]RRB15590.1 DNA-binding response regulator [Larkinella knui]